MEENKEELWVWCGLILRLIVFMQQSMEETRSSVFPNALLQHSEELGQQHELRDVRHYSRTSG